MKPVYREEVVYQSVLWGELEIDELGRIWRVANRRGAGYRSRESIRYSVKRHRAERRIAGYLSVTATVDRKRVDCLAHRLVWRHLNGRIPDGLTINHKNGDKLDNRPSNLELATYREQSLHRLYALHQADTAKNKAPAGKLGHKAAEEIRAAYAKAIASCSTTPDIHWARDTAKKYGVSAWTIRSVIYNRAWKTREMENAEHYRVVKRDGGWAVVRKDTGAVVARNRTKAGAGVLAKEAERNANL